MKDRFAIFLLLLSLFIEPMSLYSGSNQWRLLPSIGNTQHKLVVKNGVILKNSYDLFALNNIAKYLSQLGMVYDPRNEDLQLTIVNWMAIPRNHQRFFEEIYNQINENTDAPSRDAIIHILEQLSDKWSHLAQEWRFRDSSSIESSFKLCNDSDDRSEGDKKRDEADELFKEAVHELLIGSIEVAGTFLLGMEAPLMAIPLAESAYDHLSNAWEKIHESAEAYREANQVDREEEILKEEGEN